MESKSLVQVLLLCMLVLVSGKDLSSYLADDYNDDSVQAVTRILRGMRNKKPSLPLAMSKIMTGEDIEEEKKYECFDLLDVGQCESWKKADVCITDARSMAKYCQKTCGLCPQKPAPAPSPCQMSDKGCCWDGISIPQGNNQEGCPDCLKDSYSSLCKRFQDYCTKKGSNREWIRQKCPATCINLWKYKAEITFPKEELKENIVYNAWEICYSGAKGVKRSDIDSLFDGLESWH